MDQTDWLGLGPVKGRALAAQGSFEFVLPDVTSQAKVYKQRLRDFFERVMPLRPEEGEFEVQITINLNPNFPAIDLDNVAKAVLDGLKGHVFFDDSQVMRLLVEKRWADGEQVQVRVGHIT